jgi:ribosomal protein S18 acetylase RimI-like enzyme
MIGVFTMSVSVTEYRSEHLQDLLSLVVRINEADSAYPPPGSIHVQNEDWESWLFEDSVSIRLVAVKNERVVGHIVLEPVNDYITQRLDDPAVSRLEIGQFFVDPTIQKSGIGNKLFQTALEISKSLERKIALVVLDGSDDAKRFYSHHGLREVGKFTGRDGVNTIFIEN